jgi:hypothetical protein
MVGLMKVLNENGCIPENTTCPFSDECTFKHMACNGDGCPVSNDGTVDYEFSCGAARLFELLDSRKKSMNE